MASVNPHRSDRILAAIREVISTPTKRDQQVRIGPSDLADPCDHCLAAKMAGVKPRRDFSMYPWLGSAIHKLIEWITMPRRLDMFPLDSLAREIFGGEGALSELYIEKALYIEGYGWIPAHIDFVLPAELCFVDWKSSSRKKVRAYKVKGVPIENLAQVILYLEALLRNGYNVEAGVLVYIPRDAAELREMWAYEVPRNEGEAQAILDRAAVLYQWVQAGRWEELASDSECHVCNPGFGF